MITELAGVLDLELDTPTLDTATDAQAIRRAVWHNMTPEQRRRMVRAAACEYIDWLIDQPKGGSRGRSQFA